MPNKYSNVVRMLGPEAVKEKPEPLRVDNSPAQIILERNQDKEFVQRILKPDPKMKIDNPDGSVSTHRMAAEIDPETGKAYAFPTIVPDGHGGLMQLTNRAALLYNLYENNAIEFDSIDEAVQFSMNYKTKEFTDTYRKQGSENKYSNAVKQAGQTNGVELSLETALDRDPASFSKILEISKQSGLPVDTVERNRPVIEKMLRKEIIQPKDLEREYPALAEYLKDPNKASVSWDDVYSLKAAEKFFNPVHALEGESTVLKKRTQKVLGGIGAFGAELGNAFGFNPSQMLDPVVDPQRNYKNKKLTQAALDRYDREISEATPDDLTLMEEMLRSGFESAALMVPGMVYSAVTANPSPMLSIMTAQTFFDKFAEGTQAGLPFDENVQVSGLNAAIEYLTEKIPAEQFVKLFKIDPGKGAAKIVNYILAEQGGEQIATLTQSLVDFAYGLDEELAAAKTDEEFNDILKRRAILTIGATGVATGLQASLPAAVNQVRKGIEKRQQRQLEQENKLRGEQQKLDVIMDIARDSKLRELDSNQFNQALQEIQQHYGVDENVYLPASDVVEYFQSENIDINQAAESNKAIAQIRDQLDIALETEGDIVLPVADYASYIAASEYEEGLRQHVRLSADSLTQYEAQKQPEQNKTIINEWVETANRKAEVELQTQEITDRVVEQLVATGRVDPQAAAKNAALLNAYVATQAIRQNKTPEQVYQEIGLRIEGPGEISGDFLDQAAFHGSPYRFSKFQLQHIGKGEGAQAYGYGLYFAENPKVAESYRDALSRNRDRPLINGQHTDQYAPLAEGNEYAKSAWKEVWSNYEENDSLDDAKEQAIQNLNVSKKQVQGFEPIGDDAYLNNEAAKIDEAIAFISSIESITYEKVGALYEVDLDINDDQLLLWDVDIEQQSPSVRQSLNKILENKSLRRIIFAQVEKQIEGRNIKEQDAYRAALDTLNGRELYALLVRQADKLWDFAPRGFHWEKRAERSAVIHQLVNDATGDIVSEGTLKYEAIRRAGIGNAQLASDFLSELGLKGIKYLDGSSRKKGEGNYNYVIFDENAITIKNINGQDVTQEYFQPAYHGSPHKFDKFSLTKIGTGEGAQMYGHGLYFAQNASVAKTYQPIDFKAERQAMDLYKEAERRQDYFAMEVYERFMLHETPDEIVDYFQNPENEYDESQQEQAVEIAAKLQGMLSDSSNLYEVDLDIDETNTLDWDVPLSQQSESLRSILEEKFYVVDDRLTGQEVYNQIVDDYVAAYADTAAKLEALAKFPEVMARIKYYVSRELKDAGIRAVQYLDQGSRDAQDNPTRNYVMFDEEAITIKKRNGEDVTSQYSDVFFQDLIYTQPINSLDSFESDLSDLLLADEVLELSEKMDSGDQTVDIRTPERLARRTEIADELYGDGAKNKDRRAWLVLGPPASGKSTTSDPLVVQTGSLLIDSDEAKKKLPEYDGGRGAGVVHLESKEITDRIFDRAIEAGDNFVHPIVGHTYDKVKQLVDYLESKDYEVNIRLVSLPVEQTYRRSIQRFKDEGRYIDYRYIFNTVGPKPNETYLALKSNGVGSSHEAYDSDVEYGKPYDTINDENIQARIKKDQKTIAKVQAIQAQRSERASGRLSRGTALRQETPQVEKARGAIQFGDNEIVIRLLEASDPSTFFHESGHLFLELEKRQADPNNLTPDQRTILEWLGVNSFDEIQREHHEKFARGFEAYLYEGKAPSTGLREVFRHFSEWLKQVYKNLRNLNVALSDDIRKVMDRMLATDEEIALAQEAAEYAPLFRDAKSAGMTPSEWTDYQTRIKKAQQSAGEGLQQRLLSQLRRQYESWWKKEFREELDVSRETLEDLPVYRAAEFLKGNVTNETFPADKLNRVLVEEILGITREKKISHEGPLDPTIDSLLIAIAKLGGINRDVAESEGVDPEYWRGRNANSKANQPVFGKRIFVKNGGHDIGGMAELLSQYGYTEFDPNQLLEKIFLELSGDIQYSDRADFSKLFEDDNGEAETEPQRVLPRKLYGMTTTEGGLNPDDVAPVFGYIDGEAMLEDIIRQPTLNEAAHDQATRRMQEKHGDIMNDGTLEREAQEAAHNEERGRLILQELKALSRGSRQPPFNREVIRESAKELIGRTQLNEIRPDKYRKAEIRAARKAQSAMEAGNRTEAIEAKKQQAANFYLWREANEAKTKAESIRKRLANMQSRKYSTNTVNPDYIRNLKLLIAAYDFRKGSKQEAEAAKDRLVRIANWAKAQTDEGEGIEIDLLDPNLEALLEAQKNGTLDQYELKSYKEMTIDELSGLDAMARHLRFVGGKTSENERAVRAKYYEKVADEIRANAKPPKLYERHSKKNAIQKGLKQYGAQVILHADSVVRRLAGFKDKSIVYDAIKRPIDDAVTQLLIPMQEAAGEAMAKIYSKYYSTSQIRAMNKAVKIPGSDNKYTKWEMIAIALNWGTQSNRDAVLDSTIRGELAFTEEEVARILDQLTQKDWEFVQDVFNYTNSYWSQMVEIARKQKGIVPPKVEGIPIQTKYGIINGAYYPLKYDSEHSMRVTEEEASEMIKGQTLGRFAKAATREGMLKARVGSGGRPIRLDIMVWHQHINEVIQYIAMAEAVSDVNKLLSSKQIREAMSATDNIEYLKALDAWLKDTATGEIVGSDLVSRIFRAVRTGFSVSALGWNVGTILMQPLGIFNTMVSIGYGNTAKGLYALARNPFKVIEEIQKQSAFMRERGVTFNKDIKDTLTALHGKPNKPGFIPEWMRNTFFYGIVFTQRYVDALTWLGAYEQGKKTFDNDSDVVHFADRAVARSQASGVWSDRTPIERGSVSPNHRQAEYVRIFTALGSYFFAKGNIAANRFTQTQFKNPKQALKFAVDMVVLFSLEAIIVGLIRGQWPDDDDDETRAGFVAKQTGLAVLSTMPLIREMGSEISGFRGGSVLTAGYEVFGKAYKQVEQGENDLPLWKSLNNLGGIAFKYPSRQINRTVDSVVKAVDGDEVDPVDYLIWREKQ